MHATYNIILVVVDFTSVKTSVYFWDVFFLMKTPGVGNNKLWRLLITYISSFRTYKAKNNVVTLMLLNSGNVSICSRIWVQLHRSHSGGLYNLITM